MSRPTPCRLLIGCLVIVLISLSLSCDNEASAPQLAVPPDDYFHVFPFGVDWVRARTERIVSPQGADGYGLALAKLREDGMESLNDDERRLLVSVAWYASVIQTKTARYETRVVDSQGTTLEMTETEEIYDVDVEHNSSAPYLLGSRVYFAEKLGKNYADESISRYEIVNSEGARDAVRTEWLRLGVFWTCVRSSSAGPNASLIIHRELPVEFASAASDGIEKIRGRDAFKLKAAPSSGIKPFPDYLWLDVETLVPVQEQYDEGLGRYSTKTLIDINSDITIQPPDLDAPCTEVAW